MKLHHLHIELTPEQYQLLSEKSKTCGLSKRIFLTRYIEGKEVRPRPTAEIQELRREIHSIGNNINQIARSVNAGIASPEDAKQGLLLLNEVYKKLDKVVNN
ncbi:MobC family plasmid mobilization relaxosome protein [Bengtsoniella intestinalis]|uniref:MobC family plasmid mobilization relaxosome protein n=1 Tax=Bengtsoniella intestinalis TaxID=3073143 RepID=UPI00391F663A